MLHFTFFQSMNLNMIKVMQGFLDGTDEECLIHHLDMTETFAQSDKTEPDTNEPDEPDESISNEDSQIDAEKIAVHEEEIRNIYVSLAHDLKEIYLLLFDCKHKVCTFKYSKIYCFLIEMRQLFPL